MGNLGSVLAPWLSSLAFAQDSAFLSPSPHLQSGDGAFSPACGVVMRLQLDHSYEMVFVL